MGNLDSSIGYGVTSYNETKNATYGINKKLAVDLCINPNQAKIIFARGDSMEPTILGGDSILIDLSKKIYYKWSYILYSFRWTVINQTFTETIYK